MYKLPAGIREALLQYLATKPYNEVTQLINELLKLNQVKEKDGDK